MTAPPPKQLTADELPPCPFCGAYVGANAAQGALIHGLPTCDRFRQLDPLNFVIAMRQALEGKKPS